MVAVKNRQMLSREMNLASQYCALTPFFWFREVTSKVLQLW